MPRNTKHIVLLLLAGALVSLVVLTTSLPNLQLHSGTPFPGSSASTVNVQPGSPLSPTQIYFTPILRGIVAVSILIFTFSILARLIAHADLKIILQLFLALVALLILAYILPDITPAQPAYIPDESFEATAVPPFEYSITPLGQPPQMLIGVVIIGIVLGMGLLVFIFISRWSSSTKIEVTLAQEAKGAVDALQAGIGLRNVIIRCYLQMTHAIQEEQGIERNNTMTAREFEDWLEQKGFPTMPVRQLTSLFEKVRYSKQQTSNDDEKIALNSLNEIIQFCRSGKV